MAEPIKHVNKKGKVRYQPHTSDGAYLYEDYWRKSGTDWYYFQDSDFIPILTSYWKARYIAWREERKLARREEKDSFKRVEN